MQCLPCLQAALADLVALLSLKSLCCLQIFLPEEFPTVKPDEEEELLLLEHIDEIQKEKALLTSALPSLTRTTSDDDLLSTDDGSLDDVDTQRKYLTSLLCVHLTSTRQTL